MFSTRCHWAIATVLAMLLPATSALAAATGNPGPAKPYTVKCGKAKSGADPCKVDENTYIGWRTFDGFCSRCHGQDGVGSSFAPNLAQRLHHINEARFMNSVVNGYKGQMGVMPAWKGNQNVMPHLTQLYAYLKARSDGALPPGRPEKLGASAKKEKFPNWD